MMMMMMMMMMYLLETGSERVAESLKPNVSKLSKCDPLRRMMLICLRQLTLLSPRHLLQHQCLDDASTRVHSALIRGQDATSPQNEVRGNSWESRFK